MAKVGHQLSEFHIKAALVHASLQNCVVNFANIGKIERGRIIYVDILVGKVCDVLGR